MRKECGLNAVPAVHHTQILPSVAFSPRHFCPIHNSNLPRLPLYCPAAAMAYPYAAAAAAYAMLPPACPRRCHRRTQSACATAGAAPPDLRHFILKP